MKKSCFGILFFLLVTAISVSASALTITVTSASPALPIGLKQQFKATGTIGTTTKDLTSMVTWSSSDKKIAVMEGTTPGLVIGVAKGETTITAKFGSDSGTTKLTVTDPVTLTTITVEPKDSTLYIGQPPLQFKAFGKYSDATERLITTEVKWSSSQTSVATIDPEQGLAYPKSVGETKISATLSGVTGQTLLKIAVWKSPWDLIVGLIESLPPEKKPKIVSVKLSKPEAVDCPGCSGPGGGESAFMCPEDYVVTGYGMGVTHYYDTPIVGMLKIECSSLSLKEVGPYLKPARTKEGAVTAGTKGGKWDREDSCFKDDKDTTAVAVGVSGRSGGRLDAFGLWCGSYFKTDDTATFHPVHEKRNTIGSKDLDTLYGGAPGNGGSPFSERCPDGTALVGIGIKSGDEVDGITKIYCAKVEPVWDRDIKMEPRSIEMKLPQSAPEVIPQELPPSRYLPQDVQPVPPTSTPRRVPEEE